MDSREVAGWWGGGGGLQVLIAARDLLCIGESSETFGFPSPPVGWRFALFNPGVNQLCLLFLRRCILVSVIAGKHQQQQMHISPGAFCPGMWCSGNGGGVLPQASNQQLRKRNSVQSSGLFFA